MPISKKTSLLYFLLLNIILINLTFLPIKAFAAERLQPLFNEALQASNQGNFIHALKLWDHFLNLSPNNAIAISNRGNVRMYLGDLEGAIIDQTEAISLLPDELDPHINRGIAEEALMELEAAERDYKWVLSRQPDDASALYNLGNLKASQGNWKEAESLFLKASKAKPEFAMARSSKALAAYQNGQLQTSELELRKLIIKYPLFPDARAALTALLWKQGFLGEAESHWTAVVGLDGRYGDPSWLMNVRRWPPIPTNDLMSFLDLKRT